MGYVAHGPAQLVGLGGWALSCCRDSIPTDFRQTLVKRMRFVPRGESISQASIAARTILIEPLYGQLLMENKNPSGNKRVKKFFMMNFFLTFSILPDRLPEVAREFLPESRKWVEKINQDYLVLTNYVDVRNTAAKRWLRWLGFRFVRIVEDFGYEKRPFYEVVRI